jgi:hypothetical protein
VIFTRLSFSTRPTAPLVNVPVGEGADWLIRPNRAIEQRVIFRRGRGGTTEERRAPYNMNLFIERCAGR